MRLVWGDAYAKGGGGGGVWEGLFSCSLLPVPFCCYVMFVSLGHLTLTFVMAIRPSLNTTVHTFPLRSVCATAQNSQSCQSGRRLKFIRWNCKGFNHPIKRSKVLHHLQHLKADVVYLQETHLKLSDHAKLCRRWIVKCIIRLSRVNLEVL